MGYHFKNENRIGLTIWYGKMPHYIGEILDHNSDYFDVIYLLTDKNSENKSSKVVPLNCDIKEVIKICGLEQFSDDLLKLSPGSWSDFPLYFGRRIIKELTNLEWSRVLYFDANTIFFNKFTIRELFSGGHYASYFNVSKVKGYYAYNDFQDYIGGCFSLDATEYDSWKIRSQVINNYLRNTKDKSRYTLLGPSFINDDNLIEDFNIKVLKIGPQLVDPTNLIIGGNTIKHQSCTLGIKIANSLISEAEFKIMDVGVFDNEIQIILNNE